MGLTLSHIESKIYSIRGVQVMLDSDLALLYGTETKFINRAVKRNPLRFPDAFIFQLTEKEWIDLKYHFGTSSEHGGRRTMPYVFSEQGVSMLSAVLNTDFAIQVSIQIMQAFVSMRKFLMNNASVFQRLDQVELKQLKTDEKLEQIFKALEAGQPKPDKGIFFEGQIFDAYVFVADLIKKAKTNIILIDNYVDESVLNLLLKRSKKVSATIYTKNISNQLLQDLKKYNSQYPEINIQEFKESHDRFLIIDGKELYHIGASLKDLGKKWFAFSRMDSFVNEVLQKLKEGEKDG
ncbi:ORF6N domain-containing protein [Aquiflexum gelatinilyticum]|uniref:ORF6N domain-containing protein n=1 Tax=Aquiflexum gelatinilyticum TaxID=2961943 RepID=UPI00216A4C1C|nr:ORF6N domain-containing protein [Aquiflexum gelatinilyticum]MCS4436228.1 ORF6N domain-containing protein [Aquiflexum gelatinilyticum]